MVEKTSCVVLFMSSLQTQVFFKRILRLLVCNIPLFGHQRQNDFLAVAGRFVIFQGIVIARCLEKTGQQGRLGQRQVFRFFIEIDAAGLLDSRRICAEVRCVQIDFQYFILAVIPFQEDGQNQFLCLAGQGAFLCEKRVFDDLLADGAASFHCPAGVEIHYDCPGDTGPL